MRHYSRLRHGRPHARSTTKALRLQEDDTQQEEEPVEIGDAATFNYYEEASDGSGRLVRLASESEFNDSLQGLDDPTKRALRALEQRVADLQEAVRSMDMSRKTLPDPEDPGLSSEAAAALTARSRKLSREKGYVPPELSGFVDDLAETAVPRISEGSTGAEGRTHGTSIARLNDYLERAIHELRDGDGSRGIRKATMAGLWRYYSASRAALLRRIQRTGPSGGSDGTSVVPPLAWTLLWAVFARPALVDNPNRMQHVHILARDMVAAGVELSPAQRLLAIEAMFVDGWPAEALANWRRCVATLGAGQSETFREFWELGVKMYCREGDLERAERALDTVLGSKEHESDPRILIPFISACAEHSRHEKAWASYRRLRTLLGDDMTIEDYDAVIFAFLASNQAENALQAFVDMMSNGSIELRGSDVLPGAVGNKFFFGKWMKRLIGAGDLDGAHKVVSFMLEKGVEPAAIQVNGLIGAWIRSGVAQNQQKAEDMAWGMVNARLDFVRARRQRQRGNTTTYDDVSPARLPPATRETFSLLAESYRVRGLHGRVLETWTAFQEAEVAVDAFMMNQVLDSYITNGQIKEAMQLFESLTAKAGVKPDSHTFGILWKSLSINRLVSLSARTRAEDLKQARELFARMMATPSAFEPTSVSESSSPSPSSAPLTIPHPLARRVLHTLRKLGDDVGVLVALRAFVATFAYEPPEPLVMEMVVGAENLLTNERYRRGQFRRAHGRMAQAIMARRMDEMAAEVERLDGESGVDDGGEKERRLAQPFSGEELAQYLDDVLVSRAELSTAEESFEDVARQMGVYHIFEKARNSLL